MKKRNLALLLALVLVMSTVLSGCGSNGDNNNADSNTEGTTSDDSNAEQNGDDATGDDANQTSTGDGFTLNINVGGEPDTIDPALNSTVDGGILCHHAFEGLMMQDKDGVTMIPGQAEKVEISDDQLVYTFTLRDGLKWSDGSDLTANDFVYSWNRAIAPETAADYSYMFEAIEGYADGKLNVEAPDDKTIVVKLQSVTPYFLELCAFPAFFPVQQAAVEAGGDAWATDPSTYVGNGPYKLVEWVHDSYMLYEKNENYWDVASLGPDAIRFVLMGDVNAELSAFETGEILFTDDVPTEEIKALSESSEFYKEGQIGTYYVSFNTENEYLSNPLLRKALILAIDRNYICDEIGQAGQVPAGAFAPLGLSDSDSSKEFREVGGDYYNPTDYEGNLELAKEALAEAGYPNGEGLPTFEYLYNSEGSHGVIGEALQNMWSQIGVNVDLVSQEWATFVNTRKTGEYDIARNGWLGDYNDPISFFDMWITDSGNNDAQWSNTDYDALITQIKSSSDPAERMQLMHQAEDIMFDEWMLCPIYFYVDLYLLKDNVQGVYTSPLGFKFFKYATVTE